MDSNTSRRRFLTDIAAALPSFVLSGAARCESGAADPVETATLEEGDLKVHLRDNSQSPQVLSGVDALFHRRHAPMFDAFDPDSRGAGAGLNFEHIICGHKNDNNRFTPRRGKFALFVAPEKKSATLVRKREDDPWQMSSTLQYIVTPPHYIDVDFRCVPHDKSFFGKRGYAILFFADYMNDVADVALHFLGVTEAGGKEQWLTADAPKGHPDWNQGGTYRSAPAADLAYDADHNFKLNSWSYDYPRFSRPFYYGRAAHDMVFLLMFNKMYTAAEELRFSLFKFKVPRVPRPAWDFQYVIRRIVERKEYGFKARLVWKKFVSADDCLGEYETWAKALQA